MIDFDELLAANTTRFREVLAGLPETARVPSCPDWTAADLLWHLTEVQSFWDTIVANRVQSDEQVEGIAAPTRPTGREAALTLFDAVSGRLRADLGAARDDEPVWSWAANHTIGWIRRRQAHEALVHRVDAELAAGLPSEIDSAAAEDGVDELLTQFGSEPPVWGTFDPSGILVEVRTTVTGRTWWVRLGRFHGVDPTGVPHDEPDFQPATAADGPADAVLEGTAPDLLLWMWGRADGSGVEVAGDSAARAALRTAVAANTQ